MDENETINSIDLSTLSNPYDFAYPVSNEKLFAGRGKEIKDITYYLDQAKTARQPLSIAIIGARASGKTSLLNMAEIEARKRGFCTVRVNLDEGDGESVLAFFGKIFGNLLKAACEVNSQPEQTNPRYVFEGVHGKTYETYLDMVTTGEIPEDKTYCPFLFPIQFARASSTGNMGAMLVDTNLEHDLQLIQQEVNRPTVICIDETNVLSKSRVHLQKLRNIFMRLSGYMIIMVGTPDLFPAMDEVFSPIARQFKKIELMGFRSVQDTYDCIKKPIEKLVLDIPFTNVWELHTLSGGSPYEIQLMCHIMFRRVQEGLDEEMRLSRPIFEEVLRELETSRAVHHRALASKIRMLSERELRAIGLLCIGDGRLTFEQTWQLHYVTYGEVMWREADLWEVCSSLQEDGLISLSENNVVVFIGDEFDMMYCKYIALEKDIHIPFPLSDNSAMLFLQGSLEGALDQSIDVISSVNYLFQDWLKHPTAQELKQFITNVQFNKIDVQFANQYQGVVVELYKLMEGRKTSRSISAYSYSFNFPWLYASDLLLNVNAKHIKNAPLKEIGKRTLESGGQFESELVRLPILDREQLLNMVLCIENADAREYLVSTHTDRAVDSYYERKKKENVKADVDAWYSLDSTWRPNDLGYLLIWLGDVVRARSALEYAQKTESNDKFDLFLPIFNMAVIDALEGDLERAAAGFRNVVDSQAANEVRTCAALLCLLTTPTGFTVEDDRDEPDVIEIATKNLEAISSYMRLIQ